MSLGAPYDRAFLCNRCGCGGVLVLDGDKWRHHSEEQCLDALDDLRLATSATGSLQSEIEKLRAENNKLRKALIDPTLLQDRIEALKNVGHRSSIALADLEGEREAAIDRREVLIRELLEER